MERPQSIIWFERCYLGAVVIGLINTALNWSSMQERVAATPNSALLPSWFMPATIGFGLAISMLLWFLVARRASVVAKWFVTVFFVLGLLGVPGIVTGIQTGLISPIMALVALITFGLNAVAVWMLFRPDTEAWFSGRDVDLTNTFS